MSKIVKPAPEGFRYFPLGRYWNKRILPILETPEARAILTRDFKKYSVTKQQEIQEYHESQGRYDAKPVTFSFDDDSFPADLDGGEWRCYNRKRVFDKYVCKGACHWIVNSMLYAATVAFPKKQWRIVYNNSKHGGHSTVWDGDKTFFDINFLAMGIGLDYTYQSTLGHKRHRVLPIGQELKLHN